MIKIAPSIMCGDPLNVAEELRLLEECGVDMLHCDVMDGQYVDNLAMGFYLIKAIKKATSIPLDVHLAVMEPERYLDILSMIGVDMVCIHVERVKNLHRTVKKIKEIRTLALEQNPKLLIEVDGNINKNTILPAISAGANVLVLGTSALFKDDGKSYREKVDIINNLMINNN